SITQPLHLQNIFLDSGAVLPCSIIDARMSMLPSSAARIRCRQIIESDIHAVADLLTRGFPARSHRFWLHVLARMGERSLPDNLAKYGYLLERDGVPSGVILLIYSMVRTVAGFTTRCNLSSWYVEP